MCCVARECWVHGDGDDASLEKDVGGVGEEVNDDMMMLFEMDDSMRDLDQLVDESIRRSSILALNNDHDEKDDDNINPGPD